MLRVIALEASLVLLLDATVVYVTGVHGLVQSTATCRSADVQISALNSPPIMSLTLCLVSQIRFLPPLSTRNI